MTAAPARSSVAGERIAKAMARAGLCSRREAEAWILSGRVKVNGVKLASPAKNVTDSDVILIDGKPMPSREKTRLWRYHKPRGLLTADKDPQGRPTVFQNLPADLPRVVSVGRLDLNSEGLLLLTNDGELARQLELPSRGWIRRYRVRVNGHVEPHHLADLARGMTVDDIHYGAVHAALDRQQGDNAWLTMALTEGKNREIRKLCNHFGWGVSRLIRISYGPFQLGHLDKGEVEEVLGKVMREQLGLAKEQSAPQERAARKISGTITKKTIGKPAAKSPNKPGAKPGGNPAEKSAKPGGRPAGRFAGKPKSASKRDAHRRRQP